MRKITTLAVAVALASLVATVKAQAEEGGMLEITGNVDTVTGWQVGLCERLPSTTNSAKAAPTPAFRPTPPC